MAVSLNSVVGFNSKFPAKYQHVSTSSVRSSSPKSTHFTFSLPLGMVGSSVHVKERRSLCLSVADKDRLAIDTSDTGTGGAGSSISDNQLSPVDSTEDTSQSQNSADDKPGPQASGDTNGSMAASDIKQEKRPNLQSKPKKPPLTARERLRAARILSRYTESKASKSEMGSKVLDALKESDKGKKPGLPEAPTNLFDDKNRGLPKEGWTFQFPGGSELFLIAVSFVVISTIMFTTIFIVWKVGAIHYNEY